MTLEIGDNGVPLAFVALKVDVGDLGKAAEIITNQDIASDSDSDRAVVHLVLVGDLERRRKIRRVPAASGSFSLAHSNQSFDSRTPTSASVISSTV